MLGLGEASVTAALNPPSTLSGSRAGERRGARALGEGIQPSLIVEFPTLARPARRLGLTEDPSISKLVPYLRAVTTLAGGGHALGGGVERFRLVLGLQQPAELHAGCRDGSTRASTPGRRPGGRWRTRSTP